MSTYENINVEEPEQLGPGEWTCRVTWSGPSCRGSESIPKHRSTHFEAKRDAEVIASRLRNANQTAVTKGDMPPLPPPIKAAPVLQEGEDPFGEKRDMMRDQASQADTNEAHAEAVIAYETVPKAYVDEMLSKKDEEIASLKAQVNKEAAEANHYSALCGQLREKCDLLAKAS